MSYSMIRRKVNSKFIKEEFEIRKIRKIIEIGINPAYVCKLKERVQFVIRTKMIVRGYKAAIIISPVWYQKHGNWP